MLTCCAHKNPVIVSVRFSPDFIILGASLWAVDGSVTLVFGLASRRSSRGGSQSGLSSVSVQRGRKFSPRGRACSLLWFRFRVRCLLLLAVLFIVNRLVIMWWCGSCGGQGLVHKLGPTMSACGPCGGVPIPLLLAAPSYRWCVVCGEAEAVDVVQARTPCAASDCLARGLVE